jgi:homoserine kinase
VAPALCGGFTFVTEATLPALDASRPLVACLPEVVVSTREARRALPETLSLDDLVATVGAAATLVAGMARDDPELVGRGMHDPIVTPARATLIKGYDTVSEAALDAGAAGVTVSGAGPTVVAVPRHGRSRAVASAMVDAFAAVDVEATAYQTRIGDGAVLYGE